MAKVSKCIVTTSEAGKVAYAITVDTNESVYIPLTIADRVGLQEFDEITAIIIPNDRDDIPWKAIRVKLQHSEDQEDAT